MGVSILVLGESGTGKSASMRNFKADEVALANVAGKPLPFKGKFEESINTDSYRTIKKFMKESFANVVVIDDAQYLMANEFMRRATERGYDKFTEIAVNFWELVNTVKELPEDKIVIFLSHIDRDDSGNEKMKTIGKLLDEKINIPGMFTIVLKTAVSDGRFSFMTQNSGHDPVKSPMGMFPATEIDNDLKAVVECVMRYYGMPGAPEDVPVPEKKERKRTKPPRPVEEDEPPFKEEVPEEVPFESKEAEELREELEKEAEKRAETPQRKRRTRKERT